MSSGLVLEEHCLSASRRAKMMIAGEIRRKDKGAVNVQIFLKALVPIVPKP